ncbi:MAG TPA: endonuclease/exonuclease/phosphatase family protein, partial [Kofleriaceae bacterium]|nr:endonuclease/exonuclease/phosphatase family protein [Kofleriaceae bacterium]
MGRPMLSLWVATMLAACAPELGPTAPWESWELVSGAEASLDGVPPATVGDTVRVVTFNVALGRDTEALARLFADDPALTRADVLLVQEIETHDDEPRSRAGALAEALGMNYVYAPAREIDGGTHGLAILSRQPIAAAHVMRLPRVELHINPRDRIALAADLEVGGAVLRVVDVHLDTRLNVTQRIQQLRPAVLDEPGSVVVGGDLNTNPYLWVEGALPLTPVRSVGGSDQAEIIDDYMRAIGYATPTQDSGPTQDAVIEQLRLDSLFTRGVQPGD